MQTAGAPLIGRLVDRFGAHKVIVPSTVIFGLALISFKYFSTSLWHLYAFSILLGFVGVGTAPVPYGIVVSRWFDKRRGLALGLMMVGTFLRRNPHAAHRTALDHPVRIAYCLRVHWGLGSGRVRPRCWTSSKRFTRENGPAARWRAGFAHKLGKEQRRARRELERRSAWHALFGSWRARSFW